MVVRLILYACQDVSRSEGTSQTRVWYVIQGYTLAVPAALAVRPAPCLQPVLGILLTADKTGNSLLLDSLLFDTPPLCTVEYVPWGLFIRFCPPPPPLRR